MKQPARTILMIRPASFGYNAETADSNAFQGSIPLSEQQIQAKAIEEFDRFVDTLRAHSIDVMVVQDTPYPVKPDAIFPNNWFCTLHDGTMAVFPMHAANRRAEVRTDLLQLLKDRFTVTGTEDWSVYDADKLYLEGTGSMIIDHDHKIIYACISPRTSRQLLHQFAEAHGFTAVAFTATDEQGRAIYHTNVMMHLGSSYAVVCLDCIAIEAERNEVINSLTATGHRIINIGMEQVRQYAGNMLQVAAADGRQYTILSMLAYKSLSADQVSLLQQHTQLLPIDITTIETVGGGSVRCMMAEIFLDKKQPGRVQI